MLRNLVFSLSTIVATFGLTSSLQARSVMPALATYEFAVSVGADEVSDHGFVGFALIDVVVYPNSSIVVTAKSPDVEQPVSVKVSSKVGARNFAAISSMINALENVKLKVTSRDVICKMLALPQMMVNHLYVGKTMKLVDGPRGCFMDQETHPVDESSVKDALILKTMLKTLALEALESKGVL